MTIHEQLPGIPKLHLKQVGWSKATELAKVARRDGQQFDCATWLHRAQEMPKEEFKRDVDRHLTGKETEPWEILYFKVYKSQLAVIEQALETAALMLGTSKSRGYSLEMSISPPGSVEIPRDRDARIFVRATAEFEFLGNRRARYLTLRHFK